MRKYLFFFALLSPLSYSTIHVWIGSQASFSHSNDEEFACNKAQGLARWNMSSDCRSRARGSQYWLSMVEFSPCDCSYKWSDEYLTCDVSSGARCNIDR